MLDKLAEEERLAAKKKWLATPKRCRGLQLAVVKRMDHRFIVLSGYRSLKKPTMGKIAGYQAFPTTGQQLTLTLALPTLGERRTLTVRSRSDGRTIMTSSPSLHGSGVKHLEAGPPPPLSPLYGPVTTLTSFGATA